MREYLQMLIWTMFFIVIVEMTFPASNIKKYLKFVLGFVVLYVIVSPIAELVIATNYIPGESLENYIHYYQEYIGEDVEYSSFEEEKEKQQEGILELYLAQIEKQVKNMLENEIDRLEIQEIVVEGNLNDLDIRISSIELDVMMVEAAGVEIKIGEKNESAVLSEVQLKKQIQNYLNDFYNLDNANIYITVQKN